MYETYDFYPNIFLENIRIKFSIIWYHFWDNWYIITRVISPENKLRPLVEFLHEYSFSNSSSPIDCIIILFFVKTYVVKNVRSDEGKRNQISIHLRAKTLRFLQFLQKKNWKMHEGFDSFIFQNNPKFFWELFIFVL